LTASRMISGPMPSPGSTAIFILNSCGQGLRGGWVSS
jgi:hypothetical protein